MVDFNFDISQLFPNPIIRVQTQELADPGKQVKLSTIIDRMGQLSAVAQGLNRPVTSANRLLSNQIIYLLADVDNNGGPGVVTGLLKVGTKDLYLFDERGERRKLDRTPAILDFYVHESRQRTGLGKLLFENMLHQLSWTPLKCSVDRPSDKLLTFLKKHYGLVRIIPQANNFVLFEGFFNDIDNSVNLASHNRSTASGGTPLASNSNKDRERMESSAKNRNRFLTTDGCLNHRQTQITPIGRYGASHPICSMAEIMRSGTK